MNSSQRSIAPKTPQKPQTKLSGILRDLVDALRASNSDFEYAYDTYTQQYGSSKITFDADALNLVGTVDPAVLVFGRNCVVYYSDSSKRLSGTLGSVTIEEGKSCVIGRRQTQDQKLICWGSDGQEVDLSEYNASASIIPSRIHGAFVNLSGKELFYVDLGSSSGTVVVGESTAEGPFVRIYDPGTNGSSSIKLERTSTAREE
jgi:hypothetical protein